MKIAIITPLYWPSIGGVQISMRLIASHLVRRGHEVRVLTSRMASGDEESADTFRAVSHYPSRENCNGVDIRRFSSGGLTEFLYYAVYRIARRLRLPFWPMLRSAHRRRRFRFRSMLRHLQSHPPDLVIIAPYTDGLVQLGLDAASRTGAKTVIMTSLHISFSGFVPKRLALLKKYDSVIANTPFERDFLLKEDVPPEIVRTADCPVDLESMRSVTPAISDKRFLALAGKKYVLYLGRKGKGKGLSTLVDVFNEYSEELRDTHLVLGGVSTEYFEKEIRPRIKNNPSILATETLDEAAKWWLLKHASVYSMVSKVDSFGLAYLEAWLSGLPVIAADLPAMRCVIKDGEDGLLVAYADKIQLRGALSRLISDGTLARRMGEKGREKALLAQEGHAAEEKIARHLESLFRVS